MTSRTAHWSFAVPPETPYRPLRSKKAGRGPAAAFLGKRDQFLMWMARFWTFSAHSRTDSETVG